MSLNDTAQLDVSSSHIQAQPKVDPSEQVLLVRRPRSYWLTFILMLATWGLYAPFWFFIKARELKNITGEKLTPFMWFLVPLFIIAQPFALTAFLRVLSQEEEKRGLPKKSGWENGVWIVIFIALSICSFVMNKISVPYWSITLAIIGFAALIAYMEVRFNRLKSTLEESEFKGKPSFSIVEWIFVVPLLPLSLALLGYLTIYTFLHASIIDYKKGDIYTDPSGGFSFEIPGDGWSQVEIGSFSGGSSILELKSPIEFSYALVFHSDESGYADIARFRAEQSQNAFSSLRCSQEKLFSSDGLHVISYQHCQGRDLTDPVSVFSTIIPAKSEKDGVYELYAVLSAPGVSYKEYLPEFQKLARGFKPQ